MLEIVSLDVPMSDTRGTAFEIPKNKTIHGATLQVRGTFDHDVKLVYSLEGTFFTKAKDIRGLIIVNTSVEVCHVLGGHVPYIGVETLNYVSGQAIVELCLQDGQLTIPGKDGLTY